jgi:hypothetical protein
MLHAGNCNSACLRVNESILLKLKEVNRNIYLQTPLLIDSMLCLYYIHPVVKSQNGLLEASQ